jgi:hypothetical protein
MCGIWWNGKRTARRVLWALFWIALGAFILMANYGMYSLSLKRDWPILLIAYGVVVLIDLIFTRGKKPPSFPRPNGSEEERKQRRQDILMAVQEGRMKAEEAAQKIKET